MKHIAYLIIGLGISGLASAANFSPRVKFDKPLVLSASNVGVKVDRIEQVFRKSKNTWEEKVDGCENFYCNLSIQIEGRDIATANPVLGEHYFGSMNVNCGSKFSTNFSRVLFLGIRNCVESETMMDQDYCRLGVVALRKQSDIKGADKSLIRDKKDVREFWRISSKPAKAMILDKSLLPAGLNRDEVESFEIFEVSIGKTGSEFFIPSPTQLSSLAKGRDLYLTADQSSAQRDQELRKAAIEIVESIEARLLEIERSSQPKDAFASATGDLLGQLSKAYTTLLGVLSPTEFYSAEQRLKRVNQDFVRLQKDYFPAPGDREAQLARYRSQADEYLRLQGYIEPVKPVKLSFRGDSESGDFGIGIFSETDLPDESKEFYGGSVFDESWDGDYRFRQAASRAYSVCLDYLRHFPQKTQSRYACQQTRNGHDHSRKVTYSYYSARKIAQGR